MILDESFVNESAAKLLVVSHRMLGNVSARSWGSSRHVPDCQTLLLSPSGVQLSRGSHNQS